MGAENIVKHLADFSVGFGTGYMYGTTKAKEDEIKQGKNYTMAGMVQGSQTMYVTNVISKIVDQVSVMPLAGAIALNVLPIFAIIFNTGLGLVRDNYDGLKNTCNAYLPSLLALPDTLNEHVVTVINFVSDHFGDMMRIAMVVGSVALLALGAYAYGAACLTTLTYQTVDSYGLIPRKISLFMETYMPIIALGGTALGGTVLNQIFALVYLPTFIFPVITQFIQHKVDWVAKRIFGCNHIPSLEEAEAPMQEHRNLTYIEIMEILNANGKEFEADPAHYTKWVADLSSLPVDEDYNKLLNLFDTIDWTKQYEILKKKMSDDDRFLDFLNEKFPGIVIRKEISTQGVFGTEEVRKIKADNAIIRRERKALIEEYLVKLGQAESKPLTKEEYAAQWLRTQMEALTSVLKGDVRVKGSQQDLQEGINNIMKIIPHLSNLKAANDHVELEDTILKLAVEGGAYCARGIKRATSEVMSAILQGKIKLDENQKKELTPQEMYELRVRQTLQEQRKALLDDLYKLIANEMIPNSINQDVHAYDFYRLKMAIGFYPMTDYERAGFSFTDLLSHENFVLMGALDAVYKNYKPLNVFKELPEIDFTQYMHAVIHDEENQSLTDDEIEALEEIWVGSNGKKWTVNQTKEKFHRLALYMMGILRKKPKD